MTSDSLKLKAIAVRAVPYGESDMIVTLVGVETGKLTATARGCLKRGAKLRYAAEPFNFGEYVLVGKNGRYVIADCNQIESFSSITADINRYYDGCLILDALARLSEEPSPEVFICALKALTALADGTDDPSATVRDFLLGALEAGGSALDFSRCNICGMLLEDTAYFEEADGIVCKHCASEHAIEIEAPIRAYLAGEGGDGAVGIRADICLIDLVYTMLGIKINKRFLTEQI